MLCIPVVVAIALLVLLRVRGQAKGSRGEGACREHKNGLGAGEDDSRRPQARTQRAQPGRGPSQTGLELKMRSGMKMRVYRSPTLRRRRHRDIMMGQSCKNLKERRRCRLRLPHRRSKAWSSAPTAPLDSALDGGSGSARRETGRKACNGGKGYSAEDVVLKVRV